MNCDKELCVVTKEKLVQCQRMQGLTLGKLEEAEAVTRSELYDTVIKPMAKDLEESQACVKELEDNLDEVVKDRDAIAKVKFILEAKLKDCWEVNKGLNVENCMLEKIRQVHIKTFEAVREWIGLRPYEFWKTREHEHSLLNEIIADRSAGAIGTDCSKSFTVSSSDSGRTRLPRKGKVSCCESK